MNISGTFVIKSQKYNPEKGTTRVEFFDLSDGKDCSLAFGGNLAPVAPGTSVELVGNFTPFVKSDKSMYLSAASGAFTLKVVK